MISRKLNIKDKELEISQDNSFGYAGEVWDGALVLTYFISNDNCNLICPIQNMRILELGSGTGICGLTCAILGCKEIVLTDLKQNLPLIEKNLIINKSIIDSSNVKILPLDWTDKLYLKSFNKEFDVIIFSEIIYDPLLFQSLIDVLDYFVIVNKNIVLFSYTYRNKEMGFFKMLDDLKVWKYERVPDKLLDSEYRSDDIFIMRLFKINSE